MTIIVENGTGLTNANSYVSVVGFKAYWDDRNFSYSAYNDTVIASALVKATDYIDRFNVFKGNPLTTTQSLQFPRTAVCNRYGQCFEGIPENVYKATHEYAKIALSGDLTTTQQLDPSGRNVVSKKEKIGPIEQEYSFSSGFLKPSYPMADKLLAEYILPYNRVVK